MKYWQEKWETMPREELKKLQSERLVWQVKRMYENVELFRKRMECAIMLEAAKTLDEE